MNLQRGRVIQGGTRAREAILTVSFFSLYLQRSSQSHIYYIINGGENMKKKEKQRRREYFSAHYGSTQGHNGLSVGLLEYLIEDDCHIPKLRTKRDKENYKKAKKKFDRI